MNHAPRTQGPAATYAHDHPPVPGRDGSGVAVEELLKRMEENDRRLAELLARGGKTEGGPPR